MCFKGLWGGLGLEVCKSRVRSNQLHVLGTAPRRYPRPEGWVSGLLCWGLGAGGLGSMGCRAGPGAGGGRWGLGWAGGGGGGEGRLCSGDWAVVDVELEIDGLGGSTQAMTKSY